jgi:hypothetical protein
LDSYSCTPPVLGGTFTATIDVGVQGHSFAVLLASPTSAERWLGNGQVLLVGLPFRNVTVLRARLAAFECPVPADPALVGLRLVTQVAHLGGGRPMLSNACDLVFGEY